MPNHCCAARSRARSPRRRWRRVVTAAGNVAQRNVRRREHDAQRVRRTRRSACVAASIIATRRPVSVASISVWPGIRVAAGEERRLVDRRGNDSVDLSLERERNGSLDGAPRESTGVAAVPSGGPRARRLVDVDAGAARPDENEIGGVAHFARRRRFQR